MAWNMSASKRRALVKLQLRDKNGRWIEMGRGVKWYSSKRKKEIGGTVVGSQGEYALVRLNKENPTHEPALVKVPARHIEVVSSKATLSDPKAEKSNLETPEFEKPEAVSLPAEPELSPATIIPDVSDTKDDYSISDTADGNTYISRKDGEQLYFPARGLEVGDELIAPDGADETKPFSIGKGWATKGAERLNPNGPKLGKVISVEGDRYAVVQMAGGHTVEDKKNPGEQTDTVTVGLSNRVIKATPGLKEALGDKVSNEAYAERGDDEQELDPETPEADSDHIGREVPEDQQDQPELPPLDDDEDVTEPEPEYKETLVTIKATGHTLSEIQFAIETAEGEYDHGIRIGNNGKVEIYDLDGAIRALQGPLDNLLANYDPVDDKYHGHKTPKAARAIRNGLTQILDHLKELKAKKADKEANNPFLNGYDIDKDFGLGKVRKDRDGYDYIMPNTTADFLENAPVGTVMHTLDETKRDAFLDHIKVADNRWVGPGSLGSNDRDEFKDAQMLEQGVEQGVRLPGNPQNDYTPEEIADIVAKLDRAKGSADRDREDFRKNQEAKAAKEKAAEEPVTDEPATEEPEVPETHAETPETPSEPSQTEDPTVAQIKKGLAQLDQDAEDIENHNLSDEDRAAAIDEARFSFTDANGEQWTLSAMPDGDGEWSYNLTDQQGEDKASLLPSKYEGYDDLAEAVASSVNSTVARNDAEQESAETPHEPEAPAAESYNENGLTADEQRTADALARMADKTDEQGKFEQSDRLMAQYMELMKKGEARKAETPAEKPQEPAGEPESTPVEPEPVETPEEAPADVPKLIEPEQPKPSEDSPEAPKANVSLDDLERQAKADGSTVLYHGGLPDGTTLDDIDLNRNGSQQNKRGRSFGGFYLTDESSKSWSDKYAMERNGVMHGFAIDKNARIDDRGSEQIDRLSAEDRAEAAKTTDVIKGKDLLGRTQYVLLNKDVVKGVGETNLKEDKASKPEQDLPPLVEGEELELPIPGLKKQGKRTDKSAQHLKTLDGLEEGDRVRYTNAHDETSTYQKHSDGTWDLLDPEDPEEDESPLEEAIAASDLANRHKRGDLVVETAEEREEAYRVANRAANERAKKYNPLPTKPIDKTEKPVLTRAEQDQKEADSADKPWSAAEIQSDIRDWFDFAQAVKNGDTRAIETMANNKRTGDEETTIVVNDKGQPVDVTLTYNDDGDPVVRLSNFDDSKDIYGDFEIDTSVMPKHLSTLIHESINADDIAAAITERNGSADRELDKRDAEGLKESGYVKPITSRYIGGVSARNILDKAITEDPESGMKIVGTDAEVHDLDKAQDFLRDLVNDIQSRIDDPNARKAGKIASNRDLRDISAILKDVNQKQFERDGKLRPHKSLRDLEETKPEEVTPEETTPEVPEADAPEETTPEPKPYDVPQEDVKPYDGKAVVQPDGTVKIVTRQSREADKQAQKTEEPVDDSQHPLDRLGVERRTPEALAGEKYPPTQQQQDVIDAVLGGLDTIVQAKAGSGKTTTLQAIATRVLQDRPDAQILYVAFNKTVQEEAKSRMPSNVEPRTGHSISFNWVPTKMRQRFKDKEAMQLPKDVAKHLGISGRGEYKAEDMASDVMTIVGRYSFSADDTVGLQHIPDFLEDHDPKTKAALVAYAEKAWADIIDHDNGKLKIEQDHMRKLWALSRPDFSKLGGGVKASQIVFIDEAQDTPPVLAKVIADQKIQKVVVGDADQAIYGFTGATDYLSQADGDVELPLNMSWRFGPEVASVGNRFLELLQSDGRVVGGGPSSEIVSDMQDADAILVRSNSGMLGEIIRELERGRVVGISEKTMADMRALIATARWLKFGADPKWKPANLHEKLAPYRKWEEVVAAANKGGDQSLTSLKNMVEEYGVGRLKELMDQVIVDKKLEAVPEGGKFADKLTFTSDSRATVVDGKPWDTVAAKELLKQVGFRYLAVTGQEYSKGDKKGQPKKAWQAVGTPEEQEAMVAAFRKLDSPEAAEENYVKPDVIVSTAHKAKGLEWDRVRIGDDFWQPTVDEDTGELIEMVSDDELRLAYVAVTRAQKALDVGSLGYVYQYTSENGGSPKTQAPEKPRDIEDTDEPTSLEPDTTPEDHSVKAEEETGFDEPVEQTVPEEVVEPTKPVNVGLELDDEGLTPVERRRASDLEERVADVYRGNSDEDVKELENELFDLYRTGELRGEGEDIPEVQPKAEKPAEPKPVEPKVTEPEPVVPEVVEPVEEPVEVPVEEPVVEEPVKVQPPSPVQTEEPEFDDEGLTPAERTRADQLEQFIYDIFRGKGQGNRKALEKELEGIYAKGQERLRPKAAQKPKPVAPKPAEPTPETSEAKPETPSEPVETEAERTARTRRLFTENDRVVIGGDGSEIRENSTGIHRKLGKVTIVKVQPGSGRLTFIDPATGKIKSADASFISADTDEEVVGTKTPTNGGEAFLPADTPINTIIFDPEQNKEVFISANKQKVAPGSRVRHSKKGEGTVKAIYPGADKMGSIRVIWDDGSDSRVKGTTLDGINSPPLSSEAGDDFVAKKLAEIFPESEKVSEPEAPVADSDFSYDPPSLPTNVFQSHDIMGFIMDDEQKKGVDDPWDKASKMYNYILNNKTGILNFDAFSKRIALGLTYTEAHNHLANLKKHYQDQYNDFNKPEHRDAVEAIDIVLKAVDEKIANPVDTFNSYFSSARYSKPLDGWERTDLIMSAKDRNDPLRVLEEGVIQDSYKSNTVVSLVDDSGRLLTTYQKTNQGHWIHRDSSGAVSMVMGSFPVNPNAKYLVDEQPGAMSTQKKFSRSQFWDSLPIGARVEGAGSGGSANFVKVRAGLWKNELGFHAMITDTLRPVRILEAEGIEIEEVRPVGEDTYGSIPKGHARSKLLLDAPNGAQFSFVDSPESVFIKEDGLWTERVSGVRTGKTFTTASSDADLTKEGSPDIIVRLPKGQRVEDLIDPSLDESKFDIDTYDGQDVSFSNYEFETSKFNPASRVSTVAGTSGYSNDTSVKLNGHTFYNGQRVFDKNQRYLGKISSIINFGKDGDGQFNVIEPEGSVLGNRGGNWFKLADVKRQGLFSDNSPEYKTDEINYDTVSVFDIQAALKKKYPGITFQFQGLDIEAVKEYARTVERILAKFPQLRHSMHKINAEDFGDYKAGAVAVNRSDNWSARSISFNTRNYKNSAHYRSGVQEMGRANMIIKAPEGREVEYMMSHEFGHIIDYLTGNIDERRILELVSKALGRPVTDNNKSLRDELLRKKLVSEYSTRGTKNFEHMNKGKADDIHIVELVAESFADVEVNGTNASPISKLVHKELMDKLKEY
jgi:hypothetical protein